jgi:diaminobutyrate-2-oxoglutarate transaminase
MPDIATVWSRNAAHSGGKAQYLSRQDSVVSDARTSARRPRIATTRASGVFMEDADGGTYYDRWAGSGVLTLCHDHSFVIAALRRAIDKRVPFQTQDLTTPIKDAFCSIPESQSSPSSPDFPG